MCNFELATYRCAHQKHNRIAYCHSARNDPYHQCFSVRCLKREITINDADCDKCVDELEKRMLLQLAQRQQPSQYGAYGTYSGYQQH